MAKKLIKCDSYIQIPDYIAVCPACEGDLTAYADEWTRNDDGTWGVGNLLIRCESDRYEACEYLHPNYQAIIDWVNKTYDFDMVDWDKKLREWCEVMER